jgi:hypothetical protein
MVADRKYQMTRVRRGDYLLPSNDAQTLYRIHAYHEDGSAGFTGTFWGVMRWPDGMPTDADVQHEDFLDWDRWREVSWGHRSRAAAIKDVLA